MPINHSSYRWAQAIVGLAVGAWLGAWLSVLPANAAGDLAAAQFRRGIAIAHVLGWAPVEPPPSHAFVFPPFAESTESFEREVRGLRRTGFDFVRLAVDPGPFLQFKGARRDQLDRILLDRVRLILSSGLAVIVDLHPSDLNEEYSAQALTRGSDAPVFQGYLQLLARTAALLEGLRMPRVALELMNEPPVSPERWLPLLQTAYGAARARAPQLLLVLEGGDEGSAEAMMSLGRFSNDPCVLFSFHYYDPYQFTHQGAPWNAARYLADVAYPPSARPLQESIDASAAKIAASGLPPSQKSLAVEDARRRLESYRSSSFDRGTIAHSFDGIANWARNHRVPADRIILGEFGAKQNERHDAVRRAERARWFRDVRQEAEAHGFIWAAWVYRGSGGFALLPNEEAIAIDPAIADALGFAPP
jgi:endoglucanase